MRLHSAVATGLALSFLAGCGNTTFPWTSGSSGSNGGGGGSGASISVSPSSLTFAATALGVAPPAKVLTVTGQGGPLYVSVSTSGAAVKSATPNPSAGTITVTAPAPGAAGTLTGSVTVRAFLDSAGTQEVAGSPKTIPVTYTIAPNTTPTISVAAGTSLSFTAPVGRSAPAAQTFDVAILNGPFTIQATPSGTAIASATVIAQTGTGATIQVTPAAPDVYTGTRTASVSVRGCLDAGCTQLAQGSPKTIPVTYATTASAFQASPYALADVPIFAGAPASAPQAVSLADPNGTASWSSSVIYASYSVTGWLTVTPPSGTDLPATPQVSVAFPASTPPGTYTATVQFTSLGVTKPVTVNAIVSAPGVVAPPGTTTFSAVKDQTPLPPGQTLSLTTQSGGSVGYTTSVTYGAGATGWLTVPTSGTAPGPLSVAVSTSALPAGGFDATLKLTPSPANGAGPTTIPIHYDVAPPTLVSAPGTLAFTIDRNTTAAGTSATLALTSGGASPLPWRATASQPWLLLSKASGTTPDSLTASIDPAALETLATGSFSASVDLAYDLAPGTTATVKVPVQLDMLLPRLTVVWPRVSVAGVGGDVIVWGSGFPTALTGLQFGSTAASSWSVFAQDNVWVTPPTTLAAGSYLVTVANALGLSRSRARLDVVATETRTAAAVASTGTKKRIAFDDAAKVLYVANAGDGTNGKVQRHRQSNAWALAADGSDEIALTNVHNLVLSPDGKTLVVLAGTSYTLVDTATFTLKATQPTAVAPSASVVGLEVIEPERVVALAQDTALVQPAILDLATGTATTMNAYPYLGGLAASADGNYLAIFEKGLSPQQSFRVFNPYRNLLSTPGPAQEGQFGGYTRHGGWFLLFGGYNGTSTGSKLYDVGNGYVLYGGTVPPIWSGSPPSTKLATPPTLALVVSAKENATRVFTWDGTSVRAFDLDYRLLDVNGVYPLVFSVTATQAPGAGVQLAVSADEKTAFLAGDQRVVVVPLQ
jgi:hypothetical protein